MDREKIREKNRKYRAAKREKIREKNRKYRAAKRNQISDAMWSAIADKWKQWKTRKMKGNRK